MAIPLPKRRFTVADYYRMAEAGILGPGDRVELIEGEVVEMAPIGSRHAGCVKYFSEAFHRLLGKAAVVGVQDPVRLGDISEPEPDLSLLKPRRDFYRSRHPRPADALLVIEVADASVETDRAVKGALYARAGIPEFWLVDLTSDMIEVYRQPELAGWRERHVTPPGDRIAPAAFPAAELEVSNVLGVENEGWEEEI